MNSGIKTEVKGFKRIVNGVLAKNVEALISIPGGRLYRKYEDATKNVGQVQQHILSEILGHCADTVIGNTYGFKHISNHEEYCRQVPVFDYEELRPYVNRHMGGEDNVLFPGKPMIYTRSSGTTAEPKYVPITHTNFNRTIKNRSKLWLHRLSKNYPGIYSGKDLTLVSPAIEGYTEDGVPYGSLSGFIYKNIPDFVKLIHAAPYDVMCIEEYDAKVYCLLRFSVPSNITSIFTGNPATVLNIVTKGDLWKESLIRDIADGTLSTEFLIEPHVRAALENRFEPAPEKARWLEAIANQHDQFRPAQYWPELKLVHTWTNGNCRLVLPKLRPWFASTQSILDFGYIASEINATDIVDPETNGSLLAVLSGFYEFSPLAEGDNPKTFLMAHQVEVGHKYYIYVTTYSGLYRYNMNDVVEVIGHFNQAPIFKFLYKGKGITSLQGEKISENQIIEAVNVAALQTHFTHEFFEVFANFDAQRYQLYIEFIPPIDKVQIDQFSHAVDEALCNVNIEYEAKRHSQRLLPLETISLEPNAFERYRSIRQSEGALDGQYKWMHLSASQVEKERLGRLSEPPPPS